MLNFSIKGTLFFAVISSVLFMNLAIQIARFSSYNTFLKQMKFDVYLVRVSQSSTSVVLELRFQGQSTNRQKMAYISSIQLLMKIGNKDLGYHPIVGNQGMIGEFISGKFVAKADVKLSGPQAANFKKEFRKSKITYTGYLEIHVLQDGHDLRSVPAIKGVIQEEGS